MPIQRQLTTPDELGGAEEERAVAAARTGDRAAQRQLFEMHQMRVYRFLRLMTHDDDRAADLTQETFVRALANIGRLRRNGAFGAWLLTIARNLVRDHVARPLETTSPDDPASDMADPDADIEQDLLRRELAAAVDRAVAGLSVEHREVVVLHHLEGLEVADIGRILGLREGTVKSRLARARETLRRRLIPWLEG